MRLYRSESLPHHELQFNHWNQPDVDRFTTLFRQPHGTLVKVLVDIPARDMFRDALEDFAVAVRSGRALEVGWNEITRALACIEVAIRSSNALSIRSRRNLSKRHGSLP